MEFIYYFNVYLLNTQFDSLYTQRENIGFKPTSILMVTV